MTFWTELIGQPFTVEQFDANGTPTRALVKGSGEPVIFLHGISGHLEAFIPAAARFGKGFEVHLIDMLGHGWTGKPGGPITIDRLAAHVLAYMDARGIAKAHLAGISLGGWVTGWIAANHPDRLLSAVMIAAAGNPAMARPEVCDYVRKSTLAGVMSDDRAETLRRIQSVVFKPESADDEMVDIRYMIYHTPEFRAKIDGLLALTDPETYTRFALTPELLKQVTAPVLLVWGEDDTRSGVADAEFLLAYLPQAKMVQMADTGHWPPYERPADFVAIVTAFLHGGLAAVTPGRQ
jgi:2-hydroxy-6-oxonona-2,4-dienedioate hydrolase